MALAADAKAANDLTAQTMLEMQQAEDAAGAMEHSVMHERAARQVTEQLLAAKAAAADQQLQVGPREVEIEGCIYHVTADEVELLAWSLGGVVDQKIALYNMRLRGWRQPL